MSVIPGKGGQKFMPEILPTLDKLINLKSKYHYIIEIDGGINNETICYLKDKDIDIIVSGSYITNMDDYNIGIDLLKNNLLVK